MAALYAGYQIDGIVSMFFNRRLQNPLPGRRGNVGRKTIEGSGTWSFDANLAKNIKVSESKIPSLRVDALNVLNHPNPGTPTLNINSTSAFGLIQTKGNDHRTFQGTLRLNF